MVKPVSIKELQPLFENIEALLDTQSSMMADTMLTMKNIDRLEVQKHILSEAVGHGRAAYMIAEIGNLTEELEKKKALQGKRDKIEEIHNALSGLLGVYIICSGSLRTALEKAGCFPQTFSVEDIDTDAAELAAPAALRLQIENVIAKTKSGYVRNKLKTLAADKDYSAIVREINK